MAAQTGSGRASEGLVSALEPTPRGVLNLISLAENSVLSLTTTS